MSTETVKPIINVNIEKLTNFLNKYDGCRIMFHQQILDYIVSVKDIDGILILLEKEVILSDMPDVKLGALGITEFFYTIKDGNGETVKDKFRFIKSKNSGDIEIIDIF